MPESNDIHPAITVVNAVNDTIQPAHDDLPDGRIAELRNHASNLREICESLCAADKQLAKPSGALRRIQRDVTDNVSKVTPRRRGNGYLITHEGNSRSTSSIGMRLPRSISESP